MYNVAFSTQEQLKKSNFSEEKQNYGFKEDRTGQRHKISNLLLIISTKQPLGDTFNGHLGIISSCLYRMCVVKKLFSDIFFIFTCFFIIYFFNDIFQRQIVCDASYGQRTNVIMSNQLSCGREKYISEVFIRTKLA